LPIPMDETTPSPVTTIRLFIIALLVGPG
jgi:hypothetical protein